MKIKLNRVEVGLTFFFTILVTVAAWFLYTSLTPEGKPTLDPVVAINMIKSYYLGDGLNIDLLSDNYLKENPAGDKTYIFRQKYDGNKFVIKVYYSPAGIYLSECYIKDSEVLGCLNTEEGEEFIQKYS